MGAVVMFIYISTLNNNYPMKNLNLLIEVYIMMDVYVDK